MRDLAWRLECPRGEAQGLIEETRRAVTNFMEGPHAASADAVRFLRYAGRAGALLNELLGPEATEKIPQGQAHPAQDCAGRQLWPSPRRSFTALTCRRQHDVNITEEKQLSYTKQKRKNP